MTRSYILKVHHAQDLVDQLRKMEDDEFAIRIVQRLGGVAGSGPEYPYDEWLVVIESTKSRRYSMETTMPRCLLSGGWPSPWYS